MCRHVFTLSIDPASAEKEFAIIFLARVKKGFVLVEPTLSSGLLPLPHDKSHASTGQLSGLQLHPMDLTMVT